jgi:myo-inositol catabolism protein IolS
MQASRTHSESVRAIRRALDLGLNFLDTAPAYGSGESERAVAEAIAGRREEVIVATKFSHLASRPAEVRTSLEESLRRLRTDYIDLFQQHWPSADIPVADTVGELERLKQEGKIRIIGVSNWMEPEWNELGDTSRVECLQACHSLLWRSLETNVLPMCRGQEISVLAYSPLCQGILAGNLERQGLRVQNRRLDPTVIAEVRQLVERVQELAGEYSKTPAQVALRWLLDLPGMTAVIVGMSHVEHVEQNLGTFDWRLQDDHWRELSARSRPLSETLGPRSTLWGWHPKQQFAEKS